MPLRKHGTIIRSLVVTAAAATAIASVPAAASAACVQAPTKKSFAKYGDNADYSLAPGGSFEGANSWTLSNGASIVTDQENIGVTTGSKSLALPVGATALSPEFCVDETNPYFRFAAKPEGSVAGYQAVVLYKNAAGKVTQAQFTSSADASWGEGTWTPSKVSPLAVKIPLASGATASVQILFVSTGNQVAVGVGFWSKFTKTVGITHIDSVMVDPYRRG